MPHKDERGVFAIRLFLFSRSFSFGTITPMLLNKKTLTWAAAFFITACASAAPTPIVFPTYDPFIIPSATIPQNINDPSRPVPATATVMPSATATRPPTPTRVPLNLSPLVGFQNQILSGSPTPDAVRTLPTPRQDVEEYVVQPGDTLGDIAQRYGVSLQTLMDANNISDPNALEVGVLLLIPAPQPIGSGSALKIIPDSELIHGPAAIDFNLRNFIASQNGYLNGYTQDVNGALLNGADIIEVVSHNYSVNPRLLLALLEYQSGWVTNPFPTELDYPMGNADPNRAGLYRQAAWAANTLNRGYYLWKANAISTLVLADGQVIPMDATINAGTAAIQYFFSELYGYDAWQYATSETGVAVTYFVLFNNPFKRAVEPVIPAGLTQPAMSLPFPAGESWYFTGGPHGSWDSGSAWGALDFAPPDNPGSCLTSAHWVTAMADGLITRTGIGSVIQDLDNDGYEQTGWALVYMHIAAEDRVTPGEYLFQNENIGHPSCEGGVSNAAHVHVARKYNGEWIAADGFIPFALDGWVSSGHGIEYDGFLTRGSTTIEALDAAQDVNLVTR
ncbi:MAG: LysM peptidoglycan-binding domain-containing protein [Chloroflexi bacterium]|nr:LysM peptidoglycan-binding domain-containing protein [Chloroflexota bacterium]